jgi:Cys-rich repeat protein
MTPVRLLALIALALGIPAAAQVMQVQPIQVQPVQRPVVAPVLTVPQSQPSELSFDPALDPERARALIAKLRAEKRALREQMTLTLGDLQQARTAIDEMTSAGGSLVRAQCVSDTLSRRTDGGGEENCPASGYMCSKVEGTCYRQCTSSLHCAGGFVCDTGAARCIVPPVSDD